jgi:hypothetical protein
VRRLTVFPARRRDVSAVTVLFLHAGLTSRRDVALGEAMASTILLSTSELSDVVASAEGIAPASPNELPRARK